MKLTHTHTHTKKYKCCEVSHTLYHTCTGQFHGKTRTFSGKKDILELCIVAFNVSLGCINIKYLTLYALGYTRAYVPIDLEMVSTKFIT